eukprot:gene6723-biopygen1158
MVCCGVAWRGVVRCGTVWYGVIWCGTVWYGVIWCDMVFSQSCGRRHSSPLSADSADAGTPAPQVSSGFRHDPYALSTWSGGSSGWQQRKQSQQSPVTSPVEGAPAVLRGSCLAIVSRLSHDCLAAITHALSGEPSTAFQKGFARKKKQVRGSWRPMVSAVLVLN